MPAIRVLSALPSAVPMLSLAAAALAVSPADASVLMLDFGPTVAAGGSLTNSPYHAADPGFTGATWNTVGTADVAAGLLYADGSAATGVALNLGAVLNSTTVTLGTQPGSSGALGSATNTGVYTDASVGKDGIWHGSGGQTTKLGVQVTGLAAGAYDIYVTARNTNTGTGQPSDVETIYVGTGAAGSNIDTTSMSSETISFATTSNNVAVGAWVDAENYFKFTVTLAAGEALNVASGAGGARGFLNSIQVTLVPEPASLAMAALGGLLMLRPRRKG